MIAVRLLLALTSLALCDARRGPSSSQDSHSHEFLPPQGGNGGHGPGNRPGHGPGNGPGHGNMLPSFLVNATIEAKKEFFNIVSQPNLTKAQAKEELQKWADKYPEIKDAFEDSSKKMKEFHEEMKRKAEEIIANVTEAMTKIATVHENTAITIQEEREQINAIMRETSFSVRRVLRALRGAVMGMIPHPAPEGNHPGRPGGPPKIILDLGKFGNNFQALRPIAVQENNRDSHRMVPQHSNIPATPLPIVEENVQVIEVVKAEQ